VVDGSDVFVFCLAEFSELPEVTGLVQLREHVYEMSAGFLINDLLTTISANGSICS